MNQLHKELQASGVSEEEIRSLLPIASALGTLKPKKTHRWIQPIAFSLSGLAVGAFVIMIAQAALPNSLLFPIQNATDSLAVALSPSYRANLMMKRADQVDQLVAANADSNTIMTTLNEYTKQAQTYMATSDSYAAFNYCKQKLNHAADSAAPDVQAAIHESLQTIQTS